MQSLGIQQPEGVSERGAEVVWLRRSVAEKEEESSAWDGKTCLHQSLVERHTGLITWVGLSDPST